MSPRSLSPVLTVCLVLASTGGSDGAPPKTGTRKPRIDSYGDPLPAGAVARLGSVRLWLEGPAACLAFSPDNKTLAVLTTSPTHRLRIVDVTTGALRSSLDLGKGTLTCAAFSPDGRVLARADANAIRLTSTTTGKLLRRLKTPPYGVFSLAFSPDGKLLAAGGSSGRINQTCEIILWEVATGKERMRLSGHKTSVNVVAFSADGKRLLSSSDDYQRVRGIVPGSVCVWDLPGGKLRRHYPQKGEIVSFSPDGKTVACTDKDTRTLVWDLDTGQERARLTGEWLRCLFLPDGKTLITGSNTDMLCLWDLTGRKIRSFQGYLGNGTVPVCASPDGKLLASVTPFKSGDNTFRLWEVATGKERRLFAGHRDEVTCLAYSADGKTLVTGSRDGALCIWDARRGKEMLVYTRHRAALTAVVCSSDGRTVASGDADNGVHLWDCSTGTLRHRFDANPKPDTRGLIRESTFLAFAANGKRLFTGSMALRFSLDFDVWGLFDSRDSGTGRNLRTVREVGSFPAAISPGRKELASLFAAMPRPGRFESKLLLSRLDSGKVFARIEAAKNLRFEKVVFSPDSKTLATGSVGRRLPGRSQLWEVATGKELLTLEGGSGVYAFAPNGRMLAVASWTEKCIYLLSAATGRRIQKLPGHLGSVECCAFSPDGKHLATGSADSTVLIWDATAFKPAKLPVPANPSPESLEKLWRDLAGTDAARAYRAVWSLVAIPDKGLPLLRSQMKPVRARFAAAIARHIKNLDSHSFRVRQQAIAALEKLDELARPALVKLLKSKPTLEMRRRAEMLLDRLERPPTPERLRNLRAVTALELIGTGEARQVLKTLAGGAPGACLTEQARASLCRLARRTAR